MFDWVDQTPRQSLRKLSLKLNLHREYPCRMTLVHRGRSLSGVSMPPFLGLLAGKGRFSVNKLRKDLRHRVPGNTVVSDEFRLKMANNFAYHGFENHTVQFCNLLRVEHSARRIKRMRLFSYKLTSDSGFAPNPFFEVLTLATCKPRIRYSKRIGDWIAGFTSKALCGDEVGEERLIYLMQVTDKVHFSEYFSHPDFQNKIPDLERKECVYKAGDNIYKLHGNDFIQIENKNHNLSHKRHDLSGEFVLVSKKFYYFGKSPLEIPDHLRPSIPMGQSAHGALTHNSERATEFIKFVTENFEVGVHNAPHIWPPGDVSWKTR